MHPAVALEYPVQPSDHVRGDESAKVTLVEYADFECRYCRQAEPVLRNLLATFAAEVRLVFRHTPRTHAHPHAERAAEAAEAAAAQGRFWEMHDRLFAEEDELVDAKLLEHAAAIGLDVERFARELESRVHAPAVHAQARTGAHSVLSTPTVFINGVRFDDAPDLPTLTAAVQRALGSPRP
jgi:protein-disulfide isomerase